MNIVILDSNTLGDDLNLDIFNDLGSVSVYGVTSREETVERIKDQEVIITNKVILDEEVLSRAPSVKLICLTATGFNNVDVSYAKDNNIVVSNVVGYSTDSVAQHTFAMLFYLYEKLAYYDRYVKSEEYVNDSMFTHFDKKFEEVKGKTWGIVGFGNIGRKVATIAEAFGAEVIYYSTSGKNNDESYKRVGFDALLETSDIISIHAPLNEDTFELFGYKEFTKMKKSAYLINVGRGPIVHEEGLMKALEEELIAGAGIDVLSQEPMVKDCKLLPYKDSTRLLITPHIAWASVQARNTAIKEVYENIKSFNEGIPRNNVVN